VEGLGLIPASSPIVEIPSPLEQVKTVFQQKWNSPVEMNSTIRYRLVVSPDGVLKEIEPIGAASEYLNQEILSLIGQPITSPSADGKSSKIRVVITRDGQVKTSWD
jgi:hypothetical protein